MFSFAKIVTVAAFAFGTLASAVPVEERIVKARAQTITDILDALNTQVAPVAAQFAALTPSTATAENVTPIVNNIQSLVQDAVNQINAPGTTVGSGNPLGSLNTVLSTILTPAGTASNIKGVSSDFIPAFSPLGVVLATLVSLVLKTVGGLVIVLESTLVTLLGGLTVVISHLNLTPLLIALGILL
ncbi:hypothetical protein BV25DRAFT_1832310 [Artomyces pyxidatus]|uniref:Uncharacterized protein n=1 Tax=Artomyces pyxidatus TaxID=48021 RepID=A0ACB8SKB9_9AGAM|nr:hypothetical protein BV25DRAFT_1832310 [Artomyces pyxidatus]